MFTQCENKLIEIREEKVQEMFVIFLFEILFTTEEFSLNFQEKLLKLRKIQMLFEHGNIQIHLTGNPNDFNGTMLLTKVELAKKNAAVQVTEQFGW